MSTKLKFTALFLVCLFTKTKLDSSLPHRRCPMLCKCELAWNRRMNAKCNLNGLKSLTKFQLPKNLYSLDLSSSRLRELPRSFTRKISNISELILANNSLEYTTEESFDELKQLRTIDLSYSRAWPTKFLRSNLSNLETLIIKNAEHFDHYFWPSILSLPKIETVKGVKWFKACDQCNITKNPEANMTFSLSNRHSKTTVFNGKNKSDASQHVDIDKCYRFGSIKEFDPLKYLKVGFTLHCWCDFHQCAVYFERLEEISSGVAQALRLTQRLLNGLYPLASVAILLNLTTGITITTSKKLRKSPTMLLVMNLAVCDIFMTSWCVLTATNNRLLNSDEEVKHFNIRAWFFKSKNKYCPYMAFVYCVTQTTTVVTSLLVILEKYLVIVFSMRPNLRITKRITILSIFVTWFLAIAYFVYAVFLENKDVREKHRTYNLFLCTTAGSFTKVEKLIYELSTSVILGWVSLLLFFCTIPLYIHIYIVVKKSSNQMGIKREGILAKRLGILIFTNFLFSTLPMSLIPLGSSLLGSTSVLPLVLDSSTHHLFKTLLVCSVWVPAFLLCLNSSLNPYLFAFRHRVFQRDFLKIVRKVFQRYDKQQEMANSTSSQQAMRERQLDNSKNKDTRL